MRSRTLLLIVAVLTVASLLIGSTRARADGDPASDVLLQQRVFYPYDPPVSGRLEHALDVAVASAAHHGFPLRVAIIATRLDLGAVTALFDHPEEYASYLERELSYAGPVPLLVVMPAGEAVAGTSARLGSLSLGRPRGSDTDALVRAALGAVGTLSQAAGRPLDRAGAEHGKPGRASAGIIAVAGVLLAGLLMALVSVATVRRRGASTDRRASSASGRLRLEPEERRRQRRRRRRRRRVVTGGLVALAGAGVAGGIVAVVIAGHGASPGRAVLSASGVAEGVPPAAPSRPRSSGTATTVRLGPIPDVRPGPGRVFFSGRDRGREVAITFDDGFCAPCARRIIDFLLRTGDHASIFPNGVYGRSWDPLAGAIREMVARGQLTVGNHTFHHVDAVGVGPAAFATDLEENEQWIRRTFGLTGAPYFRPPYGAYDAAVVERAGALGYTHVVMWSGTVADSNLRTVAYILHAIRHWARPGAIILCHANYPPTSEALAQIFAILRSEHLRPVTIGQLLGGSPYPSVA